MHGPADVTVEEGASAAFPCFYTGTSDVPFWYIDGDVHSFRNLPSRHSYSNQSLTIFDVQLTDNGTTYQCSFFVTSSDTGILTVIPSPVGKLLV